MTEQDDQPGGRTLAEKLEYLFRTVHADDGHEYSLEHVAQALAERGGPTISATYLWQLRKGARSNPRMSHLEALATFFGVDPGYFFPNELAEQMLEDLAAAIPLRDPGAQTLARQVVGLPEETQSVLIEVAMLARRAHGLSALTL